MQQQVVHGHVHHSLPEQEGPVPREDQDVAAHRLLSGLHGRQHVRGDEQVHRGEVRGAQQAAAEQADLLSLHVRHRHREHPVRVQQRHRRHHQEQPQGLRPLLDTTTTTTNKLLLFFYTLNVVTYCACL